MVYYKPDIGKGTDVDLNSRAMIIGRNIRRLRIQKGISAKDLAESVGVKKSTISNYENARSVPRPETIKKIAEVLETSVERIKSPNTRMFKSAGDIYMDGRIPYFGDISMVLAAEATPEAVFPLVNGFDDEKSFLVKINDDNFEDLGIRSGAIVLFAENAELLAGKLVALNINGNGVVARTEDVTENTVTFRVKIGENESYTETVQKDSDIILGIAILHTVSL